MNSALASRVKLLESLGVEIEASELGCEALVTHAVIAKLFPEGKDADEGTISFDVSSLGLDEIRYRLREVELEQESMIEIVYPALRQGLTMRWRDFVRYYDDLWYPGVDDVIVIQRGGLVFLSLSHEEYLTLFRPPQRLGF